MHFHGWNYIKKRTARQERGRGDARQARVGMSASRIPFSQLSKNDSSPPPEKKPFYIIPDPVAPKKINAIANILILLL